MNEKKNFLKCGVINGLIVVIAVCFVGFLLCYIGLNFGFLEGMSKFYLGFIAPFTANGYSSIQHIVLSIFTLLILVSGITLLVLSIKKENDKKLRIYAIVLSSVLLVVDTILICSLQPVMDSFTTVYKNALQGTAYGDQYLTIIFAIFSGVLFFVAMFGVNAAAVILALTGVDTTVVKEADKDSKNVTKK